MNGKDLRRTGMKIFEKMREVAGQWYGSTRKRTANAGYRGRGGTQKGDGLAGRVRSAAGAAFISPGRKARDWIPIEKRSAESAALSPCQERT